MQSVAKRILRKIKDKVSVENSDLHSIDDFCGEQQIVQDSRAQESASDLNKLHVKFNSPGEYEQFEDGYVPRFVCPSIATFLVIVLLIIVFCILPVVYLFHCFDLLNSKWPEDQFRHVVTDHSHSNPHMGNKLYSVDHSSKHVVGTYASFKPNHVYEKKVKHIPLAPLAKDDMCDEIEDDHKFDCFPQDGANEAECKSRGCCWSPKIKLKLESLSSVGVPFCFYPSNYGAYEILNTTKSETEMTLYLTRKFQSPYPNDVSVVRVDVIQELEHRVRVRIYDPVHKRYEPPVPKVAAVEKVPENPSSVIVEEDNNFRIVRKSSNVTLMQFNIPDGMEFSDQFLQLPVLLSSKALYGLGEHRSTLKLSTDWERFVMFNHDEVPTENKNLYGSHPFLMGLSSDRTSFGIFLLNSNAMEVILQPYPAATFRTIGGILDFFIFMGPTPADVVRQYQELVGLPFMPPYWGLGFHLCRFGYKTLDHTKEVLNRTRDAGIPIDVQWNDLDYMEQGNDFTYDKMTFKDLPNFVNELHEMGMHYVPLVDAGISAGEIPGSYPPYDLGIEMDVFVKNVSKQPFIGKVWNRVSTVWPDFTHPNALEYWMRLMKDMHDTFQFDGAWIDMNEPSNFYSGSEKGCPNTSLDFPPYTPAVDGGKLFYKTLCMSCSQYDGNHYDVHNLYGYIEAIVTNFALTGIRSKRPFIISRSTFSGHGHFAGHWSGDVYSTWYDMKKTIPELLSFSIFGVPLMGADICGFNGNTTISLCQRWFQLGSFYPFSRNHNTDDGIAQDPVALGSEVVQSARKSLLTRYYLLPFLYTLFWRAHVYGDTVARPLFFEFTNDDETYNIDEQFLWGPSLMIIPVLNEGKIEVDAYLPDAVWYDFYTSSKVSARKMWITLPAPLDTIPLLVRGGYILPLQKPNTTTTYSRKNEFEIIAAADDEGKARGSLYWDDGDSLNTFENGQYILLNFTMSESEIVGRVEWNRYPEKLILGMVVVMGVQSPVNSVLVNNSPQSFSYHTINKFLKVENMKISMNDGFKLKWTYSSQ